MTEPIVYRFEDVMQPDFPFKLEIRDNNLINTNFHAHEHLQLCYIMKGTCMHHFNNKQAVLVKGDIFSIPPYVEHTMKPREGSEVEIVQIDFMPFFVNESMRDHAGMEGFVDFAYIQPFISLKDALLPKLNITSTNQIKVEQLLNEMRTELEQREEGFRLSVKADLLKLLVIVGREFKYFLQGRQEKMTIHIHRRAFHDTLQYMKEHFDEDINLESMAEKATIAPTYFSYIFKMMTGKNFIEYLNELRIQKALTLLKTTDLNVTEISLVSGFNHLSHFNRMFKKFVGITPSQYRHTVGDTGETETASDSQTLECSW